MAKPEKIRVSRRNKIKGKEISGFQLSFQWLTFLTFVKNDL